MSGASCSGVDHERRGEAGNLRRARQQSTTARARRPEHGGPDCLSPDGYNFEVTVTADGATTGRWTEILLKATDPPSRGVA